MIRIVIKIWWIVIKIIVDEFVFIKYENIICVFVFQKSALNVNIKFSKFKSSFKMFIFFEKPE